MPFSIAFSAEAVEQLEYLRVQLPKKHKKVGKTLGYLETNPKHPGLNVHKYTGLRGQNDEPVWAAYVENNTPAAYRVMFCYGPGPSQITVITITQHP